METVLFNDALASPRVSFILLDWSCRESFHSLDYLARQDVPRSDYEIIWIEYYERCADELARLVAVAEAKADPPPVDNWTIMEMPSNVYYHKHLMYNANAKYCLYARFQLVRLQVVERYKHRVSTSPKKSGPLYRPDDATGSLRTSAQESRSA